MSLKSMLKLLGAYFFRWIGFPMEPTLIKVGNPTRNSPVFLTCNFILTVKRVLKAIQNMDCFLLVAPSNGINVWCGACGGDFNSNSVISIIKTSNIDDLVDHKILILPQLSAPGIIPKKVKESTGWNVKFGPIHAKDIPVYVRNQFTKTEQQKKVAFPILSRLEMGNLYFFMLLILISAVYWITAFFVPALNLVLYLHTLALLVIVIYGSMLFLPSIPGEKGWKKVLIYGCIVVFLVVFYNLVLSLNYFYLGWDLVLSILFLLLMAEDFHGLTPIYKSELGERQWKKGSKEMSFLFSKYKLASYGTINITEEDCIGCKNCLDVCPRNVFTFDNDTKKAKIEHPDKCINCHACIAQCLGNCLNLV